MSHTIGLYEGLTRQGEIELDTMFVMEPADYICRPEGVITLDEAKQIAKVLRREPDVQSGTVGKYEWREERHFWQVSESHCSTVAEPKF
jgi:hypothetical protein